MSKLSTTPVLHCVQCGAPVKLTYCATTKSDESGELLMRIFKGMAENALCYYCRKHQQYLAENGRAEEWHPNKILIGKQ
jgi:hypothetical protein